MPKRRIQLMAEEAGQKEENRMHLLFEDVETEKKPEKQPSQDEFITVVKRDEQKEPPKELPQPVTGKRGVRKLLPVNRQNNSGLRTYSKAQPEHSVEQVNFESDSLEVHLVSEEADKPSVIRPSIRTPALPRTKRTTRDVCYKFTKANDPMASTVLEIIEPTYDDEEEAAKQYIDYDDEGSPRKKSKSDFEEAVEEGERLLSEVARMEKSDGTGDRAEDITKLLRLVASEIESKKKAVKEKAEQERDPEPPRLTRISQGLKNDKPEDTPSTVIEIIPRDPDEIKKMQSENRFHDASKIFEVVSSPHKQDRRIFKRERVECQVCGAMLKDHGYLFRHVKLLHQEFPNYKEYLEEIRPMMKQTCPNCNKEFNSGSNLASHVQNCIIREVHVCQHCSKTFKTLGNLKMHVRSIHMKSLEKRYKCPYCPANFSDRRTQQEHVNCTHDTTEIYTCSSCGKGFLTKGRLRRHSYIHGEHRYFCHYCNKGFHIKDNMNKHIEIVHERKQGKRFECPQCNKLFAVKGNMLQHLNGVHLHKFLYNCRLCNSGFRRKKDLLKHNERHGLAPNAELDAGDNRLRVDQIKDDKSDSENLLERLAEGDASGEDEAGREEDLAKTGDLTEAKEIETGEENNQEGMAAAGDNDDEDHDDQEPTEDDLPMKDNDPMTDDKSSPS